MEEKFTLNDFEKQIGQIKKLKSMQKFARFIPGMSSLLKNLPLDELDKHEGDFQKFRDILTVMTTEEKENPAIMDQSRRREIATESGTNVQDIDQMLQKFEQSKHFVKMFKKSGKMPIPENSKDK